MDVLTQSEAPKRHIAFIGFMGAGKTTCARIVAGRYGRRFVDIDDVVVAACGQTIPAIFERSGEAQFRRLEEEALAEVLARPETQIIATGGGILTTPGNIPLLRQHAVLVYLRVKPERALARIDDVLSRPLLSSAGSTEVVFALAQARATLYEAACDFSVSTNKRSPDEVVDVTVERIRAAGYGSLLA
jgi:shikimate kinase